MLRHLAQGAFRQKSICSNILLLAVMRSANILESYTVMMTLGLVLGLLTGGFPSNTKEISMGSLAVLMTLSLSTVKLGDAKGKEHLEHASKSLFLNYVLLTGVIIAIGLFFSRDYWWGWVLMAAAPSAISVVPFTSALGGITTKALFSTAANYLAALVLMPGLTLLLIGSSVSTTSLVYSLLILIVLPMAASRFVMKMRIGKSANTSMINISFAVLIFAVTGANREAFIGDPWIVLAISAGCILRTFGTGMGTELILRRMRVPKEERVGYVLFASYKNLGLTATLAIALFEPIVAVPATICIAFEVLWVIFLIGYYPRVRD
jgi:BASS family bile acid:Na+ symporter